MKLRFAVFLALSGLAGAQQKPVSPPVAVPVAVEDEPHHHLLLKNSFVEVMRVTVAPAESTLFHTHSHDGAAVFLANTSIVQQKMGAVEDPPKPIETGGLSVRTLTDGPFTHRVHTVGAGSFEVLDVEFLAQPGPASEPIAPVAAESASARLYKWVLAPGMTAASHTHVRPYLIVAVQAMRLKMTSPEGQSMTMEVKPGEFHWIDAKVTHTLANDGTSAGEIVEIEPK
jgi:quercetin dioxygenase-like cupin family protein